MAPSGKIFLSPSEVSSSRVDKVCQASLGEEAKVEYFAAGKMARTEFVGGSVEQLVSWRTDGEQLKMAKHARKTENANFRLEVCSNTSDAASQADVLEADTEPLSENHCIKGNGEVQNGLMDELEVDLFAFMGIVMYICECDCISGLFITAALNMKIPGPRSQAGSLVRWAMCMRKISSWKFTGVSILNVNMCPLSDV